MRTLERGKMASKPFGSHVKGLGASEQNGDALAKTALQGHNQPEISPRTGSKTLGKESL